MKRSNYVRAALFCSLSLCALIFPGILANKLVLVALEIALSQSCKLVLWRVWKIKPAMSIGIFALICPNVL